MKGKIINKKYGERLTILKVVLSKNKKANK
jgi:hypothetical protein